MKLNKLVKMAFIDINKESGCDGKDKDVQKKAMPTETHIKENLGAI